MKYRIVDDLTSDVMFEAHGKSLNEVFENSALAMFSVICNVKKVKPEKSVAVEVKGENAQDLLYKWLSRLVALVDTKGMFFSKFEVLEIGETRMKAKVYGEPATPAKGETVVKAVLYYGFKLEKTPRGYVARVGCDI